MKKVLLVAYFFPPVAASGSMRPLGFCRYLRDYGWLPRILCTDPGSAVPPQTVDDELCVAIPDHVRIDRVPHRNPIQALLNAREKAQQRFRSIPLVPQDLPAPVNGVQGGSNGPRSFYSSSKDFILDWAFSFPDIQCKWRRPAIRRLWDLPPTERPDLVYATGNPWTSFLVGMTLARRFGAPFVADFRDPWTLSPKYGLFNSLFLSQKAMRLERSVCHAAARIVLNTEELRDKFCSGYPEFSRKCVAITNGFDDDALLARQPADQGIPDMPSQGREPVIELCHFGAIYGDRNPKPLLQAIRDLLAERMMRAAAIRIRFTGVWDVKDRDCEELIQGLEKQGVVSREAPISRTACLQQMAQSRILLVLQAGFPLQIPAKIYEYIASGRPLLVIGGNGATANLVTRHQLGLCCANHVHDIKSLLLQLARGQAEIKVSGTEAIEHFHYHSLTGELARVYEAACADESSQ